MGIRSLAFCSSCRKTHEPQPPRQSLSLYAFIRARAESRAVFTVVHREVLTLRIALKLRSGVAVDTGIVRRIVRMVLTFRLRVGFMQSRVSARVVGRSPVECSHFVFHRNNSLSYSLLSARSFLYAAYILSWTSLLNPCSFVGRSYWPMKRSSCDKGLSFIS